MAEFNGTSFYWKWVKRMEEAGWCFLPSFGIFQNDVAWRHYDEHETILSTRQAWLYFELNLIPDMYAILTVDELSAMCKLRNLE